MPHSIYSDRPPIRKVVVANTTAPVATTLAGARAEAQCYADDGDGLVHVTCDAAKTLTAYFYDRFQNKWFLLGATAAKSSVAYLANSADVWTFPRGAMVRFVVDAGTANLGLSGKDVV